MALLLLMGKNNYYLNHANHNKEVCEYIDKKAGYNDWVITTAFYSAIYYCDYKIFPLVLNNTATQKEETYNTIDEYYRVYKKTNINKSKHFCRSRLVYIYLNKISSDFDKLWDLSQNARYMNYKIDKELSTGAIRDLEKIKKQCI